jgi:hypothetical protein
MFESRCIRSKKLWFLEYTRDRKQEQDIVLGIHKIRKGTADTGMQTKTLLLSEKKLLFS